jgi:nucleotide-binding universal stress UspA family protein
MMVLKRILVATDFGAAAAVALTYGRELARRFGASLDVVHVCDDANARAFGIEGFAVDVPDLQGQLEASAQQQLDGLLDDEDRTALMAQAVVVVSSSPALAIVEHAKQSKADLILIGTHGRAGIAHVLMGSVAERVVRTAPCPVLTVRHPEREFIRPDALVHAARAQ